MSIVVQSLWIGDCLSPMEQLTIRSHLAQGHEFHLYAYDNISGVPPGTTMMDARDILPQEQGALRYSVGIGKGSVAAGSNLFRYKLLLEKGGWWVDMDLTALRPFDVPEEAVISSEPPTSPRLGQMDNIGIAQCSCIKMPPGHPLMRELLLRTENRSQYRARYGTLGPIILRRTLKELGYEHLLPDWRRFSPFCSRDLRSVLSGRWRPAWLNESLSIHWFNEVWRRRGLNKSGKYSPRGLFASLLRFHEVSRPSINTRILEIYLTEYCNKACPNCMSGCVVASSRKHIPLDRLRSFVAETRKARWRWSRIKLFGGEPTLHPDFYEAVGIVKSLGVPVVVMTNGTTHVDCGQGVRINNSHKENTPIEHETMYDAPVDRAEYARADFTVGCFRLELCGIALSCDSQYFACAPGVTINRVFGLNLGIPSLTQVTKQKLRQQCATLCKYCGLFKQPPEFGNGTQPISKSWSNALAAWPSTNDEPRRE